MSQVDAACCPFLTGGVLSPRALRLPSGLGRSEGELKLAVSSHWTSAPDTFEEDEEVLEQEPEGPATDIRTPEPNLSTGGGEQPDLPRGRQRPSIRELGSGSAPALSVAGLGTGTGIGTGTAKPKPKPKPGPKPKPKRTRLGPRESISCGEPRFSGLGILETVGEAEHEESEEPDLEVPDDEHEHAKEPESTDSGIGMGIAGPRFSDPARKRRRQRFSHCPYDELEMSSVADIGTGTGAGSVHSTSSINSSSSSSSSCRMSGRPSWDTTAVHRRRSRGLPTQRLQRVLEEGGMAEEEEDKERGAGGVDLMLVLPVGPQPGDDEPLPKPGPDRANPAQGSASWYLKQLVCDDEVFTATSKREKVTLESQLGPGHRAARGSALPQYFRPSVVVEYPLMKLCYIKALQQAETKGQIRERVTELLLRYLTSAKCCFQVRAFLSCDGHQLFLGLCADELVLRGHADSLGYHMQLDPNVARGLLRGSFRREELHPAYVRYDIEEENKWRNAHGHTPFRSHFDTFSEAVGGSIFRGVDRTRIIERVISRVFNLEDMLELGLLTARYACHSSAQQRRLAQNWATPWLLCSPSVPLQAVRDYLGEAVTFRICFLSFLTRAFLPVVAVSLAMGFVPKSVVSQTALSMQMCIVLAVWGTVFFKLWLRTEQYWSTAWGMDTFKKREATRSRFIGVWGVSRVDRYTIVKVAPWTRQLYRRAFTFCVTCLFNVLLIATVVALFGYRHSLLRAGHRRLGQAVYYLNAFQMLVFDTVWGYLALSLTDFDNYATDTEYNEQVIQRIFITRFINSFASLFYIAFVKRFMEDCDDGSGCASELAHQLRVLFGASMARSVFRPAFSYAWFRTVHFNKLHRARSRQRQMGYSVVIERCKQSSLEVQASMPENSLSEDVEDVMDLIIELGFVMFFGCVATEIIWIFCLSNLIRIRAWGWKLLFAVRRPSPVSAAGLGALNKVVSLISASSVWCNLFLCIILTHDHYYESSGTDIIRWLEQNVGTVPEGTSSGTSLSWKSIVAVFLILERAIFLARGAIEYCIIQHSGNLDLQEKRRDAMISAYHKLIIEDVVVEENKGMNDTSVEALVHVDAPHTTSARIWQPVGVEKILNACRQVRSEADAPIPTFTVRDPGFEHPWDEQEDSDEDTDFPCARPWEA